MTIDNVIRIDERLKPSSAPPARRDPAVDVALVASAVAALTHAVTTPEHFEWWRLSGVFFGAVAIAQAGVAVWLWKGRPRPVVVLVALVANVALIGLYVWSRTAGLPFGPGVGASHGGPSDPTHGSIVGLAEPVGPLDYVTLLAQIVVVIMLLSLLPRTLRRHTATGLAWCGAALVALTVIGVL